MQELLLICAGAFSVIVYAAQGVHYVVPKTALGRAGGGGGSCLPGCCKWFRQELSSLESFLNVSASPHILLAVCTPVELLVGGWSGCGSSLCHVAALNKWTIMPWCFCMHPFHSCVHSTC
jgi:hypothetical protein